MLRNMTSRRILSWLNNIFGIKFKHKQRRRCDVIHSAFFVCTRAFKRICFKSVLHNSRANRQAFGSYRLIETPSVSVIRKASGLYSERLFRTFSSSPCSCLGGSALFFAEARGQTCPFHFNLLHRKHRLGKTGRCFRYILMSATQNRTAKT